LSSRVLSKNLTIGIHNTINLPVVMYGCQTSYLTLREEHRLGVSMVSANLSNSVMKSASRMRRADRTVSRDEICSSPCSDKSHETHMRALNISTYLRSHLDESLAILKYNTVATQMLRRADVSVATACHRLA
jgi:hypothetical protein